MRCTLTAAQLQDSEVDAEAEARQVAVPPDSDMRGALQAAVTAELQQMYGNVNTLFIHADKQVLVAASSPACAFCAWAPGSNPQVALLDAEAHQVLWRNCATPHMHLRYACLIDLQAAQSCRVTLLSPPCKLVLPQFWSPSWPLLICISPRACTQLQEEQGGDQGCEPTMELDEPPPPEPPITVALLVGGPGTPTSRLSSFAAAAGLAEVRQFWESRGMPQHIPAFTAGRRSCCNAKSVLQAWGRTGAAMHMDQSAD